VEFWDVVGHEWGGVTVEAVEVHHFLLFFHSQWKISQQ
jgi:hypothetical protein